MSYYGSWIPGYPTCVFDGALTVVGGSSNTYQSYKDTWDIRRMFSSPCTITFLTNSYGNNKASVSIKVKLEESLASGNVVHFVLWEDKVANNYRFVERRMATPANLTISSPNEEQIFKAEFDLNPAWNVNQLGVTVMVQNQTGKTVHQARAVKLGEGVGVTPASFGRIKAAYR